MKHEPSGHFHLTIASWGNSLAVRLPKGIVEELKIEKGSSLDVTVENGKLVALPESPRKGLEAMAEGINLAKLMRQVTAKTVHLPDDDAPMGKEIW